MVLAMDGRTKKVKFGCQLDLMVMVHRIGMLKLLMEVMKMLCQVDGYEDRNEQADPIYRAPW